MRKKEELEDFACDEFEDDFVDSYSHCYDGEDCTDEGILSNAMIGGLCMTGVIVCAFVALSALAYFGVFIVKKTIALAKS
jgi:hypothetical protein